LVLCLNQLLAGLTKINKKILRGVLLMENMRFNEANFEPVGGTKICF